MSGEPETRRSIEGCPEAVDHIKECCPSYDSYLSCTVLEDWAGQRGSDLSAKESRCLRNAGCDAIEKAIANQKSLCGVSFRSHRCR
jgi:hypothetical protein